MLKASEFKPERLQLTAFPTDPTQFDPSNVLRSVLGEFRGLFDGPIQSIPLPPDVELSIPRVQVGSNDGSNLLTASPDRIMCVWTCIDAVSHDLAPIAERFSGVLRAVAGGSVLRRFGMVLQRYALADDAAIAIIGQFCAAPTFDAAREQAPFRHSAGFQLHNLKRYQSPLGYTINSWVRCKTSIVRATQNPSVTVEQDINTPPKDANVFGADDIQNFAAMAVGQANQVLSLYFPNE